MSLENRVLPGCLYIFDLLRLLNELYATSTAKPVIETFKLKLDNVASPEQLARTLRTVKGKSVSIQIWVTRLASRKPDRRQASLPFD